MNRRLARGACVALLPLLGACSTLDSLNPFASKPGGPKMAELKPIVASADTRVVWRDSVGKAGDYVFVPAVVGDAVYAVGRDGVLSRFDNGRQVWRVKLSQTVSGGVGASERMVVVGTPKGEVLAFNAADGAPLWTARATSEVLSPPVIADDAVIVRSGDNRLAAFELADGKRRWLYQRPSTPLSVRVTAPPLVADRYVFAGFPGGKLVAVSLANGAPMWEGAVAIPKGVTELDRVADITSVPGDERDYSCFMSEFSKAEFSKLNAIYHNLFHISSLPVPAHRVRAYWACHVCFHVHALQVTLYVYSRTWSCNLERPGVSGEKSLTLTSQYPTLSKVMCFCSQSHICPAG